MGRRTCMRVSATTCVTIASLRGFALCGMGAPCVHDGLHPSRPERRGASCHASARHASARHASAPCRGRPSGSSFRRGSDCDLFRRRRDLVGAMGRAHERHGECRHTLLPTSARPCPESQRLASRAHSGESRRRLRRGDTPRQLTPSGSTRVVRPGRSSRPSSSRRTRRPSSRGLPHTSLSLSSLPDRRCPRWGSSARRACRPQKECRERERGDSDANRDLHPTVT